MHPGPPLQPTKAPPLPQENGGEGEDDSNVTNVRTSCTEVCGLGQWGRSCSKICLAKVFPEHSKHKAIKAYVILDDQSNRFLARPEFFELFGVEDKPLPYHLRTCSGIMETYGRKAEGFQIESLDGKVVISLPPLLECLEIPNNRVEIPTPSAVLHQPHLHHIAKDIPELDPEAEMSTGITPTIGLPHCHLKRHGSVCQTTESLQSNGLNLCNDNSRGNLRWRNSMWHSWRRFSSTVMQKWRRH